MRINVENHPSTEIDQNGRPLYLEKENSVMFGTPAGLLDVTGSGVRRPWLRPTRSSLASSRRLRSAAAAVGLMVAASCGGGSSANGGGDLPAEDFWICVANPDLDAGYRSIVDAAMVERSDGRGRDLRSIVRSVRVDREVGAVEMRIDEGDGGERDGFEQELLDLEVVAGLHRTSNGPFEDCGRVLIDSSSQV